MITMVSDFYSARQWHSAGMYCDFFRLLGREHQLILALPEGPGRTARPGRTVRLVFNRGPGPDFSGRDRALLALLRPHLHQAYLDAERRRRPVPRLTPRHWELLRLVAAGYTNTQIARRLGVSEGTVRTHLQNIYERLQVSSRTAAVTRAFPEGGGALTAVSVPEHVWPRPGDLAPGNKTRPLPFRCARRPRAHHRTASHCLSARPPAGRRGARREEDQLPVG